MGDMEMAALLSAACPEVGNRTSLRSLPETVWCHQLDSTSPRLVALYGDCEDYV